jgi:putative transposase
VLQKECTPPLNSVIIATINGRPHARAQGVLLSSALERSAAPGGDSYSLRCQLELNFRAAKQYWGVEDFMHITPLGVPKAANGALCMVNVAYHLQVPMRPRAPDDSILDLQADWRGSPYVAATIKLLPEKPEPMLLRQMLHKVACGPQ